MKKAILALLFAFALTGNALAQEVPVDNTGDQTPVEVTTTPTDDTTVETIPVTPVPEPTAPPAMTPTTLTPGLAKVLDGVIASPIPSLNITFSDGRKAVTDDAGIADIGILPYNEAMVFEREQYARMFVGPTPDSVYYAYPDSQLLPGSLSVKLMTPYGYATPTEVLRLPKTGADITLTGQFATPEILAKFTAATEKATAIFGVPFTVNKGRRDGALVRVALGDTGVASAKTYLTSQSSMIATANMVFKSLNIVTTDLILHELARVYGIGGCNPNPGLLNCYYSTQTSEPNIQELLFIAAYNRLQPGSTFKMADDGRLEVHELGR